MFKIMVVYVKELVKFKTFSANVNLKNARGIRLHLIKRKRDYSNLSFWLVVLSAP